jgi:hypothetical protein
MKTIIISCLLLFAGFAVYPQRMAEYSATNGIVYHVGDTVQLGRGSGNNGKFVFLTMGGWAVSLDAEQNQIDAVYTNGQVKIKKIKKMKLVGKPTIFFTVGGGNISNYSLMIEAAIESCEVKPCRQ